MPLGNAKAAQRLAWAHASRQASRDTTAGPRPPWSCSPPKPSQHDIFVYLKKAELVDPTSCKGRSLPLIVSPRPCGNQMMHTRPATMHAIAMPQPHVRRMPTPERCDRNVGTCPPTCLVSSSGNDANDDSDASDISKVSSTGTTQESESSLCLTAASAGDAPPAARLAIGTTRRARATLADKAHALAPWGGARNRLRVPRKTVQHPASVC
mmetsp:Transcript_20585/g.58338  ORF Transcript_20585/g.58338 Transcript_20585/m.58338 type:complete len:210 (-) Transcript_20585:18-647(-)